jgi:hypothetical protein
LNYLNPGLNVDPWTELEDISLKRAYETLGPRWVSMVALFPNRTDAMLKNRFQVLQRRKQQSEGSNDSEPAGIGTEGPSSDGDLRAGNESETLFVDLTVRDVPAPTPAPTPDREFTFLGDDGWSSDFSFDQPFLGF